MTRKHFITVAEALKRSNAPRAVVESVADALAAGNPRFDRARFLKASGVQA